MGNVAYDALLAKVEQMILECADVLCEGSWTCSEAEAIYPLLLHVDPRLADTFMLCHAQTDDADEGDCHRIVDGVWFRADEQPEVLCDACGEFPVCDDETGMCESCTGESYVELDPSKGCDRCGVYTAEGDAQYVPNRGAERASRVDRVCPVCARKAV